MLNLETLLLIETLFENASGLHSSIDQNLTENDLQEFMS